MQPLFAAWWRSLGLREPPLDDLIAVAVSVGVFAALALLARIRAGRTAAPR
jgi:hypothetical protein